MQLNQQHAFLGLSAEMGNLVEIYKEVVGFKKKVDTKEVYNTIGYISYYLARVLDELFYKHEEPFSRTDSTTLFDDIALETGKILNSGVSEKLADVEIIDLILAIPCYYKDIYVGASSKDGKAFITGVLSLISNLSDISLKLDKNYGEILVENIESFKNTTDG